MTEKLTFDSKNTVAYEANARVSIPTYDTLFSMIQSYFRAQWGEKKASLLVVGAGGGNELVAWGPTNPKWLFTGVDPSKEMLQMAEHKSIQLGLENRVRLIQGTIADLPHADSKFDAASCILVLHFIEDVQQKLELLRAIKNNLKPGAPFVLVSAYGNPAEKELQDRINVWKSFFYDVGYEPSKLEEMGKGIMNISFIPEKQIEGLVEEAGFKNTTRFYSTGLFAGWICHAE